MPFYIGNQGQCRAVETQLKAGLGLPKTPSNSDRRGGGKHADNSAASTVRGSAILELSDGSRACRLKPDMVSLLTPGQQSGVVSSLPGGVEIQSEYLD